LSEGHKIGAQSTANYMVAFPKSKISAIDFDRISASRNSGAVSQSESPFGNIFAKSRFKPACL